MLQLIVCIYAFFVPPTESFVGFYRKFPGQSLVKDSELTLFDVDESECARVCYESTKIPCKSFDFCLQSTGIHGES